MRSERNRLASIEHLLNGDPLALWNGIASQKPYSRVTTFTRATAFHQWCMEKGYAEKLENPYKQFRARNARHFKNAYKRKTIHITFEEAKRRIGEIKDQAAKEKALQLLGGGLRYAESFNVKDGKVVGKGDKERPLFGEVNATEFKKHYNSLRWHLSKVGLRPHDLRKIFATTLVNAGINQYDLCKVMGWSSINTATSYIAPREEKALNNFVKLATQKKEH